MQRGNPKKTKEQMLLEVKQKQLTFETLDPLKCGFQDQLQFQFNSLRRSK